MARPEPRAATSVLPPVPGAMLHCALLTVLTVALASLTGWNSAEPLLRPLFFALLWSFLHQTGRAHPHIRGLPMRLCETGFLVLALASAGSAVLVATQLDTTGSFAAQLRVVLDRGAIFLLGLVLLAYGLMLWIPLVLQSHRQLEASVLRTQDELHESQSARETIEQKLVEAHRIGMLGELAAGIAHDLRNPLTIVKGAAESLQRRTRSPESIAEHVEIIRRAVEKADRTIQAMLDLGRPRTPVRGPVDLDDAARELTALVHGEAKKKNLRFTTRTEHLVVEADREHLLQILVNLLLNAAHVSPQSGAIALRARRFSIGPLSVVAIAVEDRGKGLDPDVRRNLFTPFFTTRNGGTGLGLSSSRRIAQELGGALGLYPRSRGGARALLVLPAEPSEGTRGERRVLEASR